MGNSLTGQNSSKAESGTIFRVLSEFIHELNIARRHLSTYPPGHPMIISSSGRVIELLDQLFAARSSITLGVGKESLLFEDQWLDNKTPAIRAFTTALGRLGIAAISFHQTPSRGELLFLNQLLRSDRQTITEQGGLSEVLRREQISHIELTAIDYGSFRTTEAGQKSAGQDSEDLWTNFLSNLLKGKLGGNEGLSAEDLGLSPELIAELINQQPQQEKTSTHRQYEKAIVGFVKRLQESGDNQPELQKRFGQLLAKLDPGLRQHFFTSALRHLDPDQPASRELLSQLPNQLVLEVLDEFHNNQVDISTGMFDLLGNLARHRDPDNQSLTSKRSGLDEKSFRERMITIFREEDKGKFTPASYQKTLSRIVDTRDSGELSEEVTSSLRRQLQGGSIERHSCAVILNLFRPELDTHLAESFENNLIDLAYYFLEVGDFRALRYLHSRAAELAATQQPPESRCENLLTILTSSEFQQEVLNQLPRWDAEKQQEIHAYIQTSADSFANSLIARLAEEPEKSLRRVFLNTLVGLGELALPAIYAALNDRRWYLVRNLLTALQRQPGPIELQLIYPLERHPHPRVNQELLKLLFRFAPDRADSLLLQQLDSENPDQQLHAIQLAESSHSPQVAEKLVTLLTRGRVTEDNLPRKIAIVKTLAQIKTAAVLPKMEKLLSSWQLFGFSCLQQLKLEIVRSLESYAAEQARPVLKRVAASRNRELRTLAVDKLRGPARSSS